MATIQFSAQDDWNVQDLIDFLRQVDLLYSRLYLLNEFEFESRVKFTRILSHPVDHVPDESRLLIDYIEIHSPALISLKGIGRAMKQIRLLVNDWHENRHKKKVYELEEIVRAAEVMRENGTAEEIVEEFVRTATKQIIMPTSRVVKLMQHLSMSILDED